MNSTSLVVKRTLKAPRELVFDAFTKPEMMQHWFTAKEGAKAEASNELKQGGQYHLVMICKDGASYVHTGEYKEITPYSKIVFSWNSPVVQNTLVTIELKELPEGTEITLTHDLLPNEEIRQRHNEGWNGCFDNLHGYLSKQNYAVKFECNAPVEKIFQALTTEKGLKNWWTITCHADEKVGGKATFKFGETFNTMEILEIIPNKSVVWKCIDQMHKGMKQDNEWVGTQVIFKLIKLNEHQTEVAFMHDGLTPTLECYDQCFMGWTHFLKNSLKKYVETGTGVPFDAVSNVCPSQIKQA